jgi:FkbM family methyltransferase
MAAIRDTLTNSAVYPAKRLGKRVLAQILDHWPIRPPSIYWGDGLVLVALSGGGQLLVPTSDLSLSPTIALRGEYEPHYTAFLRDELKRGSTFVDVGANIGLFTVIAGHLVGPTGRVVSYECGPQALALLERNVGLNWLDDRVEVVPRAASDAVGTNTLTVPVGHFGLGSLKTPRLSSASSLSETVEVQTERLADRLSGFGFIDLIKVDVEGAELEVLKGAWPLFQSRSVGMVSIEFRSDLLDEDELRAIGERLATMAREFGCSFYDPYRRRQVSLEDVLTIALFTQLVIVLPRE